MVQKPAPLHRVPPPPPPLTRQGLCGVTFGNILQKSGIVFHICTRNSKSRFVFLLFLKLLLQKTVTRFLYVITWNKKKKPYPNKHFQWKDLRQISKKQKIFTWRILFPFLSTNWSMSVIRLTNTLKNRHILQGYQHCGSLVGIVYGGKKKLTEDWPLKLFSCRNIKNDFFLPAPTGTGRFTSKYSLMISRSSTYTKRGKMAV